MSIEHLLGKSKSEISRMNGEDALELFEKQILQRNTSYGNVEKLNVAKPVTVGILIALILSYPTIKKNSIQ